MPEYVAKHDNDVKLMLTSVGYMVQLGEWTQEGITHSEDRGTHWLVLKHKKTGRMVRIKAEELVDSTKE